MNIWISLFIIYYIACVYGMCWFVYKEKGHLSLSYAIMSFMVMWLAAPFFVFDDIILFGEKPKKWNEK